MRTISFIFALVLKLSHISVVVSLVVPLIGLFTSCDVNKKVRKKASTAFEAYAKGNKLKSAQSFEKLYYKFPESNYSGKNLYNAAAIFMEIDSVESAKRLFKVVLESDLKDNQKDSSRSIGQTRTNYKHYASFNLGKIALKQNDANLAFEYFKQAREMFPFQSDSIVSIKRQELEVDRLIAQCHLLSGRHEDALALTLRHALTNSPWNGHPAKERALDIIKTHFDPAQILKELDESMAQVQLSSSFAQLIWRNHNIVLIPFEQTVEDLNSENLFKTSLYIDLYRHVHFD